MAIITGFDIVDMHFAYVNTTPLAAAITGSVYKYRRPVNSDKEDVVLNSLALDNEQIQTGITNLNLYVPGIEISTEMGQEQMPDTARMRTLAALIDKGPVIISSYHFEVQQPPLLIEEQDTGAFYFNVRVEWKNLNF